METTIIYIILLSSILLPLLQVFLSISYFKRFAVEYLDNRQISWNPNYDRRMLVFTFIFGLVSLILAKQIWQDKTNESWFLTILYLSVIIVIFSLTFTILRSQKVAIIENENEQSASISEKFFKYDKEAIEHFTEYLFSTGKIKRNNISSDDILAVFTGNEVKNKIIWTDKYNNSTTYVTLILLYRFILKGDYFNMNIINEEIDKNFLFEKRDTQTGLPKIEKLNIGSFEQAFRNLNLNKLVRYQQKVYDEYSEILK